MLNFSAFSEIAQSTYLQPETGPLQFTVNSRSHSTPVRYCYHNKKESVLFV